MKLITLNLAALTIMLFVTSAQADNIQSYHNTVKEMLQLRQKIGINQVVKKVQTALLKIVDETVTEKFSNNSEVSASGIAPVQTGDGFMFIPYSVNYIQSSHSDVVKLIVRNAKEVNSFDDKVKKEFKQLNFDVNQYIKDNINNIIHIKSLAAQALMQASTLMDENYPISIGELEDIIDVAMQIDFSGVQEVSVCEKINYTNRSRGSEQKVSGFFGLFIGGSAKKQSQWNQMAHSKTTCDYSYNKAVTVKAGEGTENRINLSEVDRVLKSWIKSSMAKRLFQYKEQLYFPHFGSPYYQ